MFILIYDVMFSERRHTCTRLRIFQMDLKQYLFFYYFNNIASMDAFLLSICIHVQYWEGILNKALIKVLLQFCLVFCNVYIAAFCSGNWSITVESQLIRESFLKVSWSFKTNKYFSVKCNRNMKSPHWSDICLAVQTRGCTLLKKYLFV